jgi:hypothetical protein
MIKVISVRARYCPLPLTARQIEDWHADAVKCETLLNELLDDGWVIVERWTSVDGHALNLIMGKNSKKDGWS